MLHPVRNERWGVCLRQQRNAFYDALLYKKHPQLYRERIRRSPPWNYYAIVALTLLGAAACLGRTCTRGRGRASIALTLVLQLTWRRLQRTSRKRAT